MGLTAGLFVDRSDWVLPQALVGPLIYWIFICSVVGYYIVTFATQHLPASQVFLHGKGCSKLLTASRELEPCYILLLIYVV